MKCQAFTTGESQVVLFSYYFNADQHRKSRILSKLTQTQRTKKLATSSCSLSALDDNNEFADAFKRNASKASDETTTTSLDDRADSINIYPDTDQGILKRMAQLESLVAAQTVQIKRLQEETKKLREQTSTVTQILNLLRQAGLPIQDDSDDDGDDDESGIRLASKLSDFGSKQVLESFDDAEIFGKAPSSVIEAADAAGAAILSGVLAGKKRLLVDVRDAELNADVETLVQFIELAILPVAAGLEGMKTERNRLKIVFPTVGQLLAYRRTMALSAPEVVSLSTLGFDPVEQRDNLVVIVAPSPEDEEGLEAMNNLLEPTDDDAKRIDQPLVILNHHMIPLSGPASDYEVAYHLRLLSVQYISGNVVPDDLPEKLAPESKKKSSSAAADADMYDAAVEAAMKHAREVGANHGVTRAMVIRAYPKPWHVFVDLSPDTDADFEVAATFDEEPNQDEVNRAIVECLEGSEEEDQLVAQQMQIALESGQLDSVSEMLGSLGLELFDGVTDDDDDRDDEEVWNLYDEDSV
jgi:hypothetical protein